MKSEPKQTTATSLRSLVRPPRLYTKEKNAAITQNSPRSPKGSIPSPYYAHLSDLTGQGAGVEHAFLNARYYDGSRGQFLSEDPVFLATAKEQNLTDPQSLNPYSYAEDNPVTKSDPDGKQAFPIILSAEYGDKHN